MFSMHAISLLLLVLIKLNLYRLQLNIPVFSLLLFLVVYLLCVRLYISAVLRDSLLLVIDCTCILSGLSTV